jgi:GAF domain-containing protein
MATNLAMAIENVRRYEQAQRALDRLYRFQEAEVLKLWRKTLERRSEHLQVLYDRIQFTPIASTEQPFGELGNAGMETLTLTRSEQGTYLLAVPLRVHGRVTGRLVFEADHTWTDEEKSLVEAVMSQLGLALENVGLLEETRQRALFEEMAGQIAAHVRSEVEVDAMLQRALVELGQVLGAERSVVSLKLGE